MRAGIRGLIIAAAFVGPGTVTTATLVGANTGYALVWLLVFAIVATYILQEMASRLGTISGKGLSEAIMYAVNNTLAKWILGALIVAAIGVGNAAYEGGNITGAALGLSENFGGSLNYWALGLGLTAFLLILTGHYKLVEKCLIALVLLMSIVFVALMIMVGINSKLLMQGVLLHQPIMNNTTLALAIIGTTIVPYNLFLHAGLSAQDANSSITQREMSQQKSQLFASIGLGGLVTFAILSSSVTAFFISQIDVDRSNIASQFAPILGDNAQLFFGLGLFAAGLTSAITAPLAAAYAICGLFSWTPNLSDIRFKLTALLIVITGTLVATLSIQPITLILLAQTANALLLPISAILLLWVCNKAGLLGDYTNSWLQNVLGAAVVCLVLLLAAVKLIA
ncbi:NRAMP family divalent metal transporter [Glaciecola petra]|uniref:Divalent metal cation transporter n=1 Tax=Glaciecola petra TaxID=3075602 RepID=A0ABU2ZS94_9ALTE|nr:divalent metal cation transporter [Aestuariibacter sp. P117]MDT0595502.1 divalent metal cation transporter [Aestuariibacter sp. P117]